MKKFLRFLAYSILVVFLILLALPSLFHDRIKRVVIANIDKNLRAEVNFKDYSISALKHFPQISLTLTELSVTGLDDFKNDTLLKAAGVDVTFQLIKLLKGNHEINGIHLLNPLICARVLKNGRKNYDIAKKEKQTAPERGDMEISIDRWSIDNGRIVYDDQAEKTFIEVGGLYHSGSGDFKQDISDLDISTKVTDLTFQYNGVSYFRKKKFAADLQMEMNLKDRKFTFRDHSFQLGDFKFGFEGYIKLLDRGYESDLTFAVDQTEFKDFLSLLPGIYQKDLTGIETAGNFNCAGFIKGTYDALDNKVPKFRISMGVKDASFKYSHLPKALENINFDLIAENNDGDPEHSRYEIKDLHFEIDKQPTHGNISVEGVKPIRIRGELVSDLDIGEIEKLYPVDGVTMKGKLKADIKVDGVYHDSLGLLPPFTADIRVENAVFKYKKLPKAIDNINFHLVANNTDGMKNHTSFKIPVFHFDVDRNPVHGSISVQGLSDMMVNADIKLKADLAHIEQIYPVAGVTLKGMIDSEIKIDGRYNDSLKLFPKADVYLKLENGYVKSKNMPVEMDSIRLSAEITNTTGTLANTQLNLNHLTFSLDDEPFVMSGTVSDLTNYNYKMKIDGMLDLEKLTKLYSIAGSTVQGTLDFDVVTRGSLAQIEAKNYGSIKAKGTLEAKNVSYKNSDLAFPIHVDDALLTFNAHKIELTRFKGEFGKSNVDITGHLTNYVPFMLRKDASLTGDVKLTCDTMDLNEWFPTSMTTTASTASASVTADTVATEVLVIPSNISFVFDSDIKMVKFGDLDIANLDGEIRVRDGVLTLNETGFNTLNSEVNIRGDYNTRDNKHPMFDLDINIRKMDFDKAYRTFIDPKEKCPASGNFSTTYSITGELTPGFSPVYSTLKGSGTIVIDSVNIKGMKLMNHIHSKSGKAEFKDPTLRDVVIRSEIRNGKFIMFPFTFQVSRFLTEVEGEQGLEDDSVNYLIKLSVPPFNRLKIPMSVKGTTDKPVITTAKGFDDSDFEGL